MTNSRVCILSALIIAALACDTQAAPKKKLTPKQIAAAKKCFDTYYADNAYCEKYSKTQEIKDMLRDLEAKDPEYYRRISAAMRGGEAAELWPPEPDRYTL